MKHYEDNSARDNCISWALFMSALGAVMVATSGCSFKVESGWHGKTGRDDRVQTRLVNGGGYDGDEDRVPPGQKAKW